MSPDGKTSWADVYTRLEFIIGVLRTGQSRGCYVLDEGRAALALEVCRQARDGERNLDEDGDQPGYRHLIAFLSENGQSLDWVFWGDPTMMIACCAERDGRCRQRRGPVLRVVT